MKEEIITISPVGIRRVCNIQDRINRFGREPYSPESAEESLTILQKPVRSFRIYHMQSFDVLHNNGAVRSAAAAVE